MAGATNTLQVAERYTAINKLSQSPEAIFASVLQLNGAINITSAHLPSDTWFAHALLLERSIKTGFLESVDNVRGDTNSFAEAVIITFTSAPALINNLTSMAVLYAAILPVMPNSIFFSFNIKNDGSTVVKNITSYLK